MAYPYYGDDNWDYRGRRPSPRRNFSDVRRGHNYLDPNMIDGGGLYRTRSQGHGPVPIVNVYNDIYQDNYQRAESPYPPYPPSPGYGGRRDNRLGADLADAIEDLTLETRRRSRSRGRSDVGLTERREDYYDWERRREDRIKERLELERVRSDQDEKDKKQRIIDDYERKKRQDEDDAKEEEKRIRAKIKQDEIDAKEKEEQEWKE